jgi:hypothetical protein
MHVSAHLMPSLGYKVSRNAALAFSPPPGSCELAVTCFSVKEAQHECLHPSALLLRVLACSHETPRSSCSNQTAKEGSDQAAAKVTSFTGSADMGNTVIKAGVRSIHTKHLTGVQIYRLPTV